MIIYFTGTGNSRYLAKHLAEQLNDECVDSAEYMRKKKAGAFSSEKPYVFVYPTYAYRMPKVFEAWLRKSRFEGNSKAYFVMDCGADTGNAGAYVSRLCEEKKLEFMGLLPVVMPDNYVVMYTVTKEEEVPGIIEKATEKIDAAAEKIKGNETFDEVRASVIDKLKSGVINDLFVKSFMKTKKFHATDACVSCGLCEKVCPLGNITLVDGKPAWGEHCTHCVACISRCPKTAIEYGKATKGRKRYYLGE